MRSWKGRGQKLGRSARIGGTAAVIETGLRSIVYSAIQGDSHAYHDGDSRIPGHSKVLLTFVNCWL